MLRDSVTYNFYRSLSIYYTIRLILFIVSNSHDGGEATPLILCMPFKCSQCFINRDNMLRKGQDFDKPPSRIKVAKPRVDFPG